MPITDPNGFVTEWKFDGFGPLALEKHPNESGGVEERRSYDPFGRRRNPAWGQPPPASFASKTTLGFTGHESDDEVGLINARGRVYDPKVGRFLTTDPVVSDLYFGQTLNPYSYVIGNPLTFVDPSGFQPAAGVVSQPGYPDAPLPYEEIKAGAGSQLARYLNHEGPPPRGEPPPKEKEDARQAGEVGAAAPPTDVDTTGSSPEIDSQAATTAPEEGLESSTEVRGGLGYAYGVGQSWLPGGFLVPSAQPKDWTFEFWRGAGQFSAGVVEVVAGVGLIYGGGAAVGGGIAGAAPTGGASLLLSAVGVSGMTAGWVAVVHGATGVVAGIATIADSMSLSTGSGATGSGAAPRRFAERSLTGSGKHGLKWTEGPARATKTGNPQGQFGSQADLDFAVEQAKRIAPGSHAIVPLPPGHSSFVHLPGNGTVPANRVFIKVYDSGKVHAYPLQ